MVWRALQQNAMTTIIWQAVAMMHTEVLTLVRMKSRLLSGAISIFIVCTMHGSFSRLLFFQGSPASGSFFVSGGCVCWG
jgi:hypothetical protein